jgi:hypothetical protein
MNKFALAIPVAVAVALAAGTSVIRGGQEDDPFIGHSDRGETVHVLPTPARVQSPFDRTSLFAPVRPGFSVYKPSYGSGNLKNHGGHEIPGAGFFAVYWNGTVANAGGSGVTSLTYTTIQSQIADFVSHFADGHDYSESDPNADYTVIQQYGKTDPIASSLNALAYYVDNQAAVSTISDTQIQSYLAGLFAAGTVSPNSSMIYGVYFPAGTTVTLGSSSSCSNFCGYHSHFAYGGQDIKYAAFPYPNCSGCKLSTLSVADMLTIVSSHEIREAVTDADGSAWYDNARYEADDKCAWHNLYQMNNGGFWVQPEYSNGGTVTASGFTATYPQLSSRSGGCVVAK